MTVCGALILASVLFRLVVMARAPLAAYVLLPARMDALAIGAWAALAIRGSQGSRGALRAAAVAPGPLLVAIVALGLLSAGSESHMHPLQQSVGFTLWALLFAAAVVGAAAVNPRVLSVAPLAFIGRISYGLYVIHLPVLFALRELGALELGFGVYASAGVGSTLVLAALSWRYLEAPLLALKRRFPYETAGAAGGTAQPAIAPPSSTARL
jgi:peptidoglycan/LPS O-acetylase OafA/YrhL